MLRRDIHQSCSYFTQSREVELHVFQQLKIIPQAAYPNTAITVSSRNPLLTGSTSNTEASIVRVVCNMG